MPNDAANTALIVMAVAASVQALTIIAILIWAVVAVKRMQAQFDARYLELVERVDQLVPPIRHAVEAMERVSNRATTAIGRVDHLASVVQTTVAAPRSLMAAGAAALAGLVLRRFQRRRANHAVRPHTGGSRAIN